MDGEEFEFASRQREGEWREGTRGRRPENRLTALEEEVRLLRAAMSILLADRDQTSEFTMKEHLPSSEIPALTATINELVHRLMPDQGPLFTMKEPSIQDTWITQTSVDRFTVGRFIRQLDGQASIHISRREVERALKDFISFAESPEHRELRKISNDS